MAFRDIKKKSDDMMGGIKAGSMAVFYIIMAIIQFGYQVWTILRGNQPEPPAPEKPYHTPLFPDSEPHVEPPAPAPPRAHRLKDLIDRIRNR